MERSFTPLQVSTTRTPPPEAVIFSKSLSSKGTPMVKYRCARASPAACRGVGSKVCGDWPGPTSTWTSTYSPPTRPTKYA